MQTDLDQHAEQRLLVLSPEVREVVCAGEEAAAGEHCDLGTAAKIHAEILEIKTLTVTSTPSRNE